jgi:hypothetical protein
MAAHSYDELLSHIGHDIECVAYGSKQHGAANIAVECITCGEVLFDFDKPDEESSNESDTRTVCDDAHPGPLGSTAICGW